MWKQEFQLVRCSCVYNLMHNDIPHSTGLHTSVSYLRQESIHIAQSCFTMYKPPTFLWKFFRSKGETSTESKHFIHHHSTEGGQQYHAGQFVSHCLTLVQLSGQHAICITFKIAQTCSYHACITNVTEYREHKYIVLYNTSKQCLLYMCPSTCTSARHNMDLSNLTIEHYSTIPKFIYCKNIVQKHSWLDKHMNYIYPCTSYAHLCLQLGINSLALSNVITQI